MKMGQDCSKLQCWWPQLPYEVLWLTLWSIPHLFQSPFTALMSSLSQLQLSNWPHTGLYRYPLWFKHVNQLRDYPNILFRILAGRFSPDFVSLYFTNSILLIPNDLRVFLALNNMKGGINFCAKACRGISRSRPNYCKPRHHLRESIATSSLWHRLFIINNTVHIGKETESILLKSLKPFMEQVNGSEDQTVATWFQ